MGFAQRYEFDAWKRQVDAVLVRLCGMTSDDLPDAPYADWFHGGKTPEQAAKKTLARAKEF